MISIVLPLTVKIVLNLISQSYTRSRIFCGMFFYFELHSKLDWGGFFSIFIVVSMMKDSIFTKLFLQQRSRDFSWRNDNNNNNLLLNLMCHLCYSSMCAYLTIYLHQTSSFSVVHTYSGPLTIILLVTIKVSAKIWKKNNLGKFHYIFTANCRTE